jgi:hypothetical protein
MQYLFRYEDLLLEKVDFFEKGKFWSVNGKKVRAVGSIPQNPQVLKLQEVDAAGKPIGKPFVGKKGDIKGYKAPAAAPSPAKEEEAEQDPSAQAAAQEPAAVEAAPQQAADPKVAARYKELLAQWKAAQKAAGKNSAAGEGTRKRLMNQAASEASFDETTDVDKDLAKLKKRPSYDVADRLSGLLKSGKVKKPENVLKYVDFLKAKISSGDSTRMSLN